MISAKKSLSGSASPFASFGRRQSHRQAIALISIQADPASEKVEETALGQSVYVRQVGEALCKLGWQVDIFTRKTNPKDATIVEHSPYCRTIRLVAGPETAIADGDLIAYLPEFVKALQKFAKGTSYPIVQTHDRLSGWVGLQLQQASNVQLIHTYHAPSAIADTQVSLERRILEQANRIVATNPQELEILSNLVTQREGIELIPCGTDVKNFHAMPKTEAKTKFGFDPNQQIVLYVGQFAPHKGIDTLVRAFAQCRENNPKLAQNSRLVLVGGGATNDSEDSERQRIEQLVRELELENCTQFAGRVGHDLLPFYYTAADVCVIPSYYEPYGLVAIEAMACGTPVVASAVGGLKFTVMQSETGLLVPPQDTEAFASAIARILTDQVWAKKLRKQASLRVQENFSWASVAIKLSDLYRRLLAQLITQDSLLASPVNSSESNPTKKLSLTKVS
ncbi:MAG: glycosyltransferase [Oscillatoria sp. PMC 1051.18]|nr:glycosyltransferase [Oscillatoria sp. PMC 1050.18]MEC5030397.1 glycosyltransferase [Oscillatoria sp. PMC 1051.18]